MSHGVGKFRLKSYLNKITLGYLHQTWKPMGWRQKNGSFKKMQVEDSSFSCIPKDNKNYFYFLKSIVTRNKTLQQIFYNLF